VPVDDIQNLLVHLNIVSHLVQRCHDWNVQFLCHFNLVSLPVGLLLATTCIENPVICDVKRVYRVL